MGQLGIKVMVSSWHCKQAKNTASVVHAAEQFDAVIQCKMQLGALRLQLGAEFQKKPSEGDIMCNYSPHLQYVQQENTFRTNYVDEHTHNDKSLQEQQASMLQAVDRPTAYPKEASGPTPNIHG